jgi:hypothetical protein
MRPSAHPGSVCTAIPKAIAIDGARDAAIFCEALIPREVQALRHDVIPLGGSQVFLLA